MRAQTLPQDPAEPRQKHHPPHFHPFLRRRKYVRRLTPSRSHGRGPSAGGRPGGRFGPMSVFLTRFEEDFTGPGRACARPPDGSADTNDSPPIPTGQTRADDAVPPPRSPTSTDNAADTAPASPSPTPRTRPASPPRRPNAWICSSLPPPFGSCARKLSTMAPKLTPKRQLGKSKSARWAPYPGNLPAFHVKQSAGVRGGWGPRPRTMDEGREGGQSAIASPQNSKGISSGTPSIRARRGGKARWKGRERTL
jgi:hypothetical protein